MVWPVASHLSDRSSGRVSGFVLWGKNSSARCQHLKMSSGAGLPTIVMELRHVAHQVCRDQSTALRAIDVLSSSSGFRAELQCNALEDVLQGGVAIDHELRRVPRQMRGHLQRELLAALHVRLGAAALPPGCGKPRRNRYLDPLREDSVPCIIRHQSQRQSATGIVCVRQQLAAMT